MGPKVERPTVARSPDETEQANARTTAASLALGALGKSVASLSGIIAGSSDDDSGSASSKATIVDAIRETEKSFADLLASLDAAAASAKENKSTDRNKATEPEGSSKPSAPKTGVASKDELSTVSDARFKFALAAYAANAASSA